MCVVKAEIYFVAANTLQSQLIDCDDLSDAIDSLHDSFRSVGTVAATNIDYENPDLWGTVTDGYARFVRFEYLYRPPVMIVTVPPTTYYALTKLYQNIVSSFKELIYTNFPFVLTDENTQKEETPHQGVF